MKNTVFTISETFRSQDERERKQNLQDAVDRYLRFAMESAGPAEVPAAPTGGDTP
ncbi:hypothetical protein H8711_07375 [Clostridiaceae bacterium NSJ-31]|uniref:Uncharacterized protein n=1 Tax=Ligaoa zhengdingensis TaxID=2763658 RepID=A0A926I3W3_9FIRM|nr:hypothetical protein [Ligaoa zhengdingensis]MBC8546754.1 hypothetical protein [Ligaoa zhengdingensis]